MWKLIVVILVVVLTYCCCVKFGLDNRYTCHCNNDEQCNQETGVCGEGCATGWSGTSCQKQNVALRKPSRQVTTGGDRISDLAVDGNRSTKRTSCADTGSGTFTRWWRVDLEDDYPIKDITIFYISDPSWAAISLTGYSIRVSKENQDPQLCFKDTDFTNKPSVNNITCGQTLTGRYVNISNFHILEDARYLALCEVEIYVCSVGTFGSDCINLCHCLNNEKCSETGQCTGGCADGWTGTICSQKCPSGSYGAGCNDQCNVNCKNSADCHHVSGKCTDGCKPGYNDDQCLQKCPSGSYGAGCNNQCSVNCKNSADCHHVSGKCTDGCKPGYKDDQCVQTCDDGSYGPGCTKLCSERNCLVETSPCSNTNGKCEGGCTDGFLGMDCVKVCDNGKYGTECTKLCSERNCLKETSSCNNINGKCESGCKDGIVGIDCVTGCDEGWYGIGCSKKCSERKCKENNVQCDSKTGECIDGCQPGYQSVDCTRECNEGTYGQNCQSICTARFCHILDMCSPIDGACGCLEGYQGSDCSVKKEAVKGGEDNGKCTGGNSGSGDNEETGTIVGTIISLIIGIMIGIIIGTVLIPLIKKRRLSSKSKSALYDTVTSNKPSNNVTHQVTTNNHSVTQPSSNTSNLQDEHQYGQLNTIYQNENAYEPLQKP